MWWTVSARTCSSSPSRSSVARSRGPRARSNGRHETSSTRAGALRAPARPPAGPRGPPRRGVTVGREAHALDGPAVRSGERGAQRLVAAHQVGEALAQGARVQGAAQPSRPGHVVRCPAPHLVEEPEALLGEGERQVALARDPARAARRSPLPHAAGALDRPGEARDRRVARRAPGTAGPSRASCARPRSRAWREASARPSSKKLVVGPDPLAPEHVAPDRRQRFLDRRARQGARPSSAALGLGLGQRAAVDLAARRLAVAPPGRRRPRAPCTRAARPCSHSRRGAGGVRRPRRGSPGSGAERRRRPAAARPGGPPGRARRTPTPPGASAASLSISPSSTRKPRSFTCWSRRPRNASAPSARHRARSPVR